MRKLCLNKSLLETTRLILRRMNGGDIAEISGMRRDVEVMRFIRAPQEKDESAKWIELVSSRWETERIGFCAVIEKATDKLIGWCGLWRLVETGEIEVGYAIARDFWGKGYATEAANKMLEYGFESLALEKIVAVAHPENRASQNVMKRLGMGFAGTGTFYGKELVQYDILKAVWEKRPPIGS